MHTHTHSYVSLGVLLSKCLCGFPFVFLLSWPPVPENKEAEVTTEILEWRVSKGDSPPGESSVNQLNLIPEYRNI